MISLKKLITFISYHIFEGPEINDFSRLYEIIKNDHNYLKFTKRHYGHPYAFFSLSNAQEIQILLDKIISDKVVLDYGSGLGAIESCLKQSNWSGCIHSYDPAITNNKIKNKKYDSIIILDSFYMKLNPYGQLNQLKENLAPNGRILLAYTFNGNPRSKSLLSSLEKDPNAKIVFEEKSFLQKMRIRNSIAKDEKIDSYILKILDAELNQLESIKIQNNLKRFIFEIKNQ